MFKEAFSFWGKSNRDPKGQGYDLVLTHAIDSGCVALAMWDLVFDRRKKNLIKSMLGIRRDAEARLALAWIVSMHDVGKVSPGFEGKVEELAFCLKEGYEPNKHVDDDATDHGMATLDFFMFVIATRYPEHKKVVESIGRVLAGHHGKFKNWQETTRRLFGDGKWDEARTCHCDALNSLFGKPDFGKVKKFSPVAICFLAGFVALCDWISSDKRKFGFFSPTNEKINCDEAESEKMIRAHFRKTLTTATDVVKRIGFVAPSLKRKKSFKELFGFHPYDSQKKAGELARSMKGPLLIIIEDQTGCGKTEAGLWALAQAGLLPCYTGLPTQAMANLQRKRYSEFFRAYYDEEVPIALAHSRANYVMSNDSVLSDDFLSGKRTAIFSPCGIGTIDQPLMGVIKCKHYFTRLFALFGRSQVFDEIHSYDAYMSENLTTLIGYLKAMGCSIVLMTATLTTEKKREFVQAFSSDGKGHKFKDHFPSILVYDGKSPPKISRIKGRERLLNFSMITTLDMKDDSPLLHKLNVDFKDGGCVAVVRTVIDDVQRTYRTLVGEYGRKMVRNWHARHVSFVRARTEKELYDALGVEAYRGASRPERLIVVASPILGECLNISFDGMYGDLAPLDVLIQRMGRIHRFVCQLVKEGILAGTAEKKLVYNCLLPPMLEGSYDWGSVGNVYLPFLLDNTARILSEYPVINDPRDTKRLVNLCYPDQNTIRRKKDEAMKDYEKRQTWEKILAAASAIPRHDGPDTAKTLLRDDDEHGRTRHIEFQTSHIVCAKLDNSNGHVYVGEDWKVDLGLMSELRSKDRQFWQRVISDVRAVEAKVPVYFKNDLSFMSIPEWEDVHGYRIYATNEEGDFGLCLFVNDGCEMRCKNVIIDDSGIYIRKE